MNNKKTAPKTRKQPREVYQRQYLKTRRDRYASDEAYRESIKERERSKYRERRAAEGRPVTAREHGANVGQAKAHSHSYREPSLGSAKTGKSIWGMNIKELSAFLQMSESGLRAWIRTERFPEPAIETHESIYVYSPTQVNKLARVLNKDLNTTPTLRSTDTEIINKLFASV